MSIETVIVTYNGEEYISRCLYSLLNYFEQEEITVVDNNSSDGTVEVISSSFPRVNIISNNTNLGFGTACNIGSKETKSDFIMFLNQDSKLIDFNKAEILKKFKDEKVGVMGGIVIGSSGQIIHSVGKKLSPFRILMNWIFLPLQFLGISYFGLVMKIDLKSIYNHDLHWINGHLMIVDKSVFSKVGGFDEEYFMYVEEADLCTRIKEIDYQISYNPGIKSMDFNSVRNGKGGVSRMVIHNSLVGHGLYISKNSGKITGKITRIICSVFSIIWGAISLPVLFLSIPNRKSSLSLIWGGLSALFGPNKSN